MNSEESLKALVGNAHSALQVGNLAEAIRLFEMGGNLGSVDCCYSLGKLYENGEVVEKDLHKSRLWYKKASMAGTIRGLRKAADGGSAQSSFELAELLMEEGGAYEEASKYYNEAAKFFHKKAIEKGATLGAPYCLIRQAEQCESSDKKLSLLIKASVHDEPEAWYQLGMLYLALGENKEASFYMSKAADREHPCAMLKLAEMLEVEDCYINRNKIFEYRKKGINLIGALDVFDEPGMDHGVIEGFESFESLQAECPVNIDSAAFYLYLNEHKDNRNWNYVRIGYFLHFGPALYVMGCEFDDDDYIDPIFLRYPVNRC